MSYVSVWKPVHDQIVQASRNAENEIIGLLLGKLESDTIIIEDSITGEFETEKHSATLKSDTLAKIADDLVNQRVKGSIVGWYHSHTEGGLFLSDTDIQTQKNLQQFSSLVTALVVDSGTGEVGYFRVDPRTGRQIRIQGKNVTVFEEPGEAIPPERKEESRVRPTPTLEVRQVPQRPKQPSRNMILALVLVTLALSMAVFGIALYRGTTAGSSLTIKHDPIPNATIGTAIQIKATVNGTIRSVSLFYSLQGASSPTEALMTSSTPSQYSYSIPGDKVTGNIVYYIKAIDTLGNQAETGKYTIPVADFGLSSNNLALTVLRNSSASATLNFVYTNGFNDPLLLSVTGVPEGVAVTFTPNPLTTGTTKATVNLAARSDAANGMFSLTVTAAYTPSGSPQVVRQTTAQIIVTDFDLQVSPSSRTVSAGASVTYTVTLTIAQGFPDQVRVSVLGLPQGASYDLATSGTTLLIGGTGVTTLTLRVTITASLRSGNYALMVIATGGGLTHHLTIQLTVR